MSFLVYSIVLTISACVHGALLKPYYCIFQVLHHIQWRDISTIPGTGAGVACYERGKYTGYMLHARGVHAVHIFFGRISTFIHVHESTMCTEIIAINRILRIVRYNYSSRYVHTYTRT